MPPLACCILLLTNADGVRARTQVRVPGQALAPRRTLVAPADPVGQAQARKRAWFKLTKNTKPRHGLKPTAHNLNELSIGLLRLKGRATQGMSTPWSLVASDLHLLPPSVQRLPDVRLASYPDTNQQSDNGSHSGEPDEFPKRPIYNGGHQFPRRGLAGPEVDRPLIGVCLCHKHSQYG